jgi:hypothetical protein
LQVLASCQIKGPETATNQVSSVDQRCGRFAQDASAQFAYAGILHPNA